MYLALMRGLSTLTPGLLEDSNDLAIYWRAGEAVLAGQLPYRDFFIEYPPGSIPAFVPPAVFSDGKLEYISLFAREMALLLVASLLLTMLAGRRLTGGWLVPGLAFAGGAALLYPVAVTRYDAVVALSLSVAVYCAALGGRWVYVSYASLGFGAAAKLVPALAAVPLIATRGRKFRGLALAAVVGLAICAPALIFGGGRFFESLAYQSERGIQVESVYSSVLLWLGMAREVSFDFGAFEVVGPYTAFASAISLPLTAALILLTCAAMYREHSLFGLSPRSFPRYAAALTLAFMVASKVISPQYLIWLLPLVPLAGGGLYAVSLCAVFLSACWLTTLVFPTYYTDLLNGVSPGPELLLARNFLLVVLLALTLAPSFLPGRKKTGEAT